MAQALFKASKPVASIASNASCGVGFARTCLGRTSCETDVIHAACDEEELSLKADSHNDSVRLFFDLLRPCNFLAKRITRWDAKCDARLHRLMCYVNSTLDHHLVGFVGDDLSAVTFHLACDSDFAGCP